MLPAAPKTFKAGHFVGLEFDHLGVRGARLSLDAQGKYAVARLSEMQGDLSEEPALVAGLRQVKDGLGLSAKDTVVTCLAGKLVSATQIPFRRLPPEEMEPALRLEMRKQVSFDLAGSSLDYQVLGNPDEKAGLVQVLVALSADGMVSRHLRAMDQAGIKPAAIDVLPVASAKALWAWADPPKSDAPMVALHLGPQVTTVVVDGTRSPFFNRYVYVPLEDFVGREPGSPEMERRLVSLAEEVARSLAFYEKSAMAGGFAEILLLGEYLDIPGLADRLRRTTGLHVRKMDLPGKLGPAHDHPQGRFDLATALAMRGGED